MITIITETTDTTARYISEYLIFKPLFVVKGITAFGEKQNIKNKPIIFILIVFVTKTIRKLRKHNLFFKSLSRANVEKSAGKNIHTISIIIILQNNYFLINYIIHYISAQFNIFLEILHFPAPRDINTYSSYSISFKKRLINAIFVA